MNAASAKRLYDASYSRRYRQADEESVRSENYRHTAAVLREISCSFGRRINVLDIGCGTGRYFRCLGSVQKLVGVDISQFMLQEGRNPVGKEEITNYAIELICGDIREVDIDAGAFDLIYSIGVLGEHAPFDSPLCDMMHEWLNPGGKAYFTVVDRDSKKVPRSWKKRSCERLYPFLPLSIKRMLQRRWAIYYLELHELQQIMKKSRFARFDIKRRVSTSVGWVGAHFECLAMKRDCQ